MTIFARFKKRFYFIAARYFRFFANFSLRRWRPRIIAITGSVGKTTMLHLIESQLGDKAHYSHYANSAFGIAFDLLGLKGVNGSKWRWLQLFLLAPIKALYFSHQAEFYIVEIDGERPYETEFLASWLRPEITLWVSIGLSHAIQFEHQVSSGLFPDLQTAITHEFATLPKHTASTVYIDADSELMQKATRDLPIKIRTFSKSAIKHYSVDLEQTIFRSDSTTYRFASPQPQDLAIQLLMLEALLQDLKLPLDPNFENFLPPAGRSRFFKGKQQLNLIDSSYNAHLISVQSILEMTQKIKLQPKWLVIGDIVDQGSIEGQEHQKLADLIIQTQPDQVILIGRRTKTYTAPKLQTANIPTFTTLSPKSALKFIKTKAKPQTTLIFKGSQYLEWIIEQLLLDPQDAKFLPRREKAARKRRAKRGLN